MVSFTEFKKIDVFHSYFFVMSWRHVMTSQKLLNLSGYVHWKDVVFRIPQFFWLLISECECSCICGMISCHDIMSWRHVNIGHHPTVLTNVVVEPYWDYYTNSMLIWVVGIKQIIDTIFQSCRQHDTTTRHDVTMWRHAIVWNWSSTSMFSIIACQLTSFTYILLNCSILSS